MTTTEPAFRSGGGGDVSRALEALALVDELGLVLDEWQRAFVVDTLATRPDGKWCAREAGLVCPRQNGKGRVLEAIELAGLFVFGEALIIHSAHEFKTCAEAFRRLWSWIEGTHLEDRVARKVQNNNDHLIELHDGRRIRFVARTGGSARGFTGDRIVLDEAYNLPEHAISALIYTTAARPNPQILYASSAPLPGESSAVLRRICKRGRQGDPGLVYAEYKADDDSETGDVAAWGAANPGYPALITDEAIRMELGLSLPADFARERLGIWPEETDAFRVVPAEAWARCLHPDERPALPVSYALDVSPNGASAAIAVSDRTAVDIVEHRDGTGWVVGALVERLPKGDTVVLDPSGPAGVLVEPLAAAEIRVRAVKTREHVAAVGTIFAAIMDGTLSHPGHPGLDAAASGADRRDVGDGGWLWSRRRSTVDISPLVAATLARGSPSVTRAPRIHMLSPMGDT